MAMVVAIRGQHVIKVSNKAYETMFRPKGYKIVEEGSFIETNTDMDIDTDFEEVQEEETEKEIETIPVSEMNKEQLAEYAKEHNIDTSGAKNVREARQIIQQAIKESKM